MGNECQYEIPEDKRLMEQPHLNKHMSFLFSAKDRSRYQEQLATLQLKQAIKLYKEFYLSRLSPTETQSTPTNSITTVYGESANKCKEEAVGSSSRLSFFEQIAEQMQLSKITEQECEQSGQHSFEESLRVSYQQPRPQREEFQPISDSLIVPNEWLTDLKQSYQEIGLKAIQNNELAVVLMTGKQGFNINFDQSIATYDIGLDSTCSILAFLIKRLHRLAGLASTQSIKLYIMTNTANKQEIKDYVRSLDYGSQNIFFFSQISVPVLDLSGKVVLKSQANILTSPLGNGMLYSELKRKKVFEHMGSGVKYLFVGPVDNILMKIADPAMLGFMIKERKQTVFTCVDRNLMAQPIPYQGTNFGYIGKQISGTSPADEGRYKIYEHLRHPPTNAKWVSTGSCFMTINAAKHFADSQDFAAYCSVNRQIIVKERLCFLPDSQIFRPELCLFFELHYHEILSFQNLSDVAFAEVHPREQFSPIKRKQGAFSIESARRAVRHLHSKWAQNYDFQIDQTTYIEINPHLSYDGQNLSYVLSKYADENNCITQPHYINQ